MAAIGSDIPYCTSSLALPIAIRQGDDLASANEAMLDRAPGHADAALAKGAVGGDSRETTAGGELRFPCRTALCALLALVSADKRPHNISC